MDSKMGKQFYGNGKVEKMNKRDRAMIIISKLFIHMDGVHWTTMAHLNLMILAGAILAFGYQHREKLVAFTDGWIVTSAVPALTVIIVSLFYKVRAESIHNTCAALQPSEARSKRSKVRTNPFFMGLLAFMALNGMIICSMRSWPGVAIIAAAIVYKKQCEEEYSCEALEESPTETATSNIQLLVALLAAGAAVVTMFTSKMFFCSVIVLAASLHRKSELEAEYTCEALKPSKIVNEHTYLVLVSIIFLVALLLLPFISNSVVPAVTVVTAGVYYKKACEDEFAGAAVLQGEVM
eukprot:TRINITY_DN31930_c0_g1_i1.p1 TRINITY_DN31930_c0_g1~~TRINITY_DN31930_c0_g1_i1.p1  ORF type:complete len:294 (-),score=62.19 TRINITY_DN31930_c0_g1_i1:270-1151(-)